MPELPAGATVEVTSESGSKYQLKNVEGVYSCSCPAWRNQSLPIDRRTCKHLRQYRGEQAEQDRLGETLSPSVKSANKTTATKPPLLLAHAWDNEQDLTDWWLGEKLDGVRAYWDGQQFLSRQGNRFHAPAWFTVGLPRFPLDGELWLDRKRFQPTVSIVRRQDAGDAWKQLSYVVFDAPAIERPFEGRQTALNQIVPHGGCRFARVLTQIRCTGSDHLRQELARIEALGGEGLMLRQPESAYVVGRSSTLLKVKTFHDGEARVIGHLPGTGRHKGRLGALLVELPQGTQFAVGTGLTDAERESSPGIGSVITFRYQELTDGGVPRFPSFVRVRRDEPNVASRPQLF